MRFGREIDDPFDFGHETVDQGRIANISLDEGVSWRLGPVAYVAGIPRVGQ